jgi:hypothetical protein
VTSEGFFVIKDAYPYCGLLTEGCYQPLGPGVNVRFDIGKKNLIGTTDSSFDKITPATSDEFAPITHDKNG